MGNSGDNKEHLEQAVLMGHLDAEQVSITSTANLKAAKIKHADTDERNNDQHEFVLQLQGVNDFLTRIDEAIALLEAQIEDLLRERDEARTAADLAFQQMHDAEDLIDAMEDGVSAKEREAAVRLLGTEAKNAPDETLILLLHAYTHERQSVGHQKSQEVEDLEQRIEKQQKILKATKTERDNYRAAQSPEDAVAIEQRANTLVAEIRNSYENQLQEKVDFNVPDFAIWGQFKAVFAWLKINLKALTKLLLPRLLLPGPEHQDRSLLYRVRYGPSTAE